MGAHGRAPLPSDNFNLENIFQHFFDNFLKNVQNDLKHILVKSVHGRAPLPSDNFILANIFQHFLTIFSKNVQNDLKHILVKSIHGRAWTRPLAQSQL